MRYPLIIIGAGLSGLAAGIRFARFGQQVLILEQHHIPGGLNSYYYRQGRLLETGLHAMTNFAEPNDRHAPLNRLFRQLKLSRKEFSFHQQNFSRVVFPDDLQLCFSNDMTLLESEVKRLFPESIDRFRELVAVIDAYDPFAPRPWLSSRDTASSILQNDLLLDMLLLPLMMYGNSNEHDMDMGQFVIMFRAVFQEGFFRPAGTIKDFLDLLVDKYKSHGGEILYKTKVDRFVTDGAIVTEVVTDKGEHFACDAVISTAGYPNTLKMLNKDADAGDYEGRVSFVESVYFLKPEAQAQLPAEETIIFYNYNKPFDYQRPAEAIDPNCGVICFPSHFQQLPPQDDTLQLRITHPANYELWKQASPDEYHSMKTAWRDTSQQATGKIIGNYRENIVYQDTFTPTTIERFTGKAGGAVYGSPIKIKDGRTTINNLYVAGTDQGYLGIVGSMLSGVTMVNQHILGKV